METNKTRAIRLFAESALIKSENTPISVVEQTLADMRKTIDEHYTLPRDDSLLGYTVASVVHLVTKEIKTYAPNFYVFACGDGPTLVYTYLKQARRKNLVVRCLSGSKLTYVDIYIGGVKVYTERGRDVQYDVAFPELLILMDEYDVVPTYDEAQIACLMVELGQRCDLLDWGVDTASKVLQILQQNHIDKETAQVLTHTINNSRPANRLKTFATLLSLFAPST